MKPYAILLFIPFLAACDLSALEGKPSPAKAEVERRAALTMTVEPAVQQVAFVQPVTECVTEWRIRRCESEGELPW